MTPGPRHRRNPPKCSETDTYSGRDTNTIVDADTCLVAPLGLSSVSVYLSLP